MVTVWRFSKSRNFVSNSGFQVRKKEFLSNARLCNTLSARTCATWRVTSNETSFCVETTSVFSFEHRKLCEEQKVLPKMSENWNWFVKLHLFFFLLTTRTLPQDHEVSRSVGFQVSGDLLVFLLHDVGRKFSRPPGKFLCFYRIMYIVHYYVELNFFWIFKPSSYIFSGPFQNHYKRCLAVFSSWTFFPRHGLRRFFLSLKLFQFKGWNVVQLQFNIQNWRLPVQRLEYHNFHGASWLEARGQI